MTQDEKLWVNATQFTDIAYTEDYVLLEYEKEYQSEVTVDWCKLMLAGILGSWEAAKEKYPEIYI